MASFGKIFDAIACGDVDSLDRLGDTIRQISQAIDVPPLHFACIRSLPTDSAVVRCLLKHVTDIDHLDLDGWTALMCSARSGKIKVAELLLQAKADPGVKSTKAYHSIPFGRPIPAGSTALDIARMANQEAMIEFLSVKPAPEAPPAPPPIASANNPI